MTQTATQASKHTVSKSTAILLFVAFAYAYFLSALIRAIAAMLLFMFAIMLLFDPRPSALRSLAKTIYPTIRRVNHDR